jgi:hypothetical protein
MIHEFALLNIVVSSCILTPLLSVAYAEQWKLEAYWCLKVGNTMSSAYTYFGLIL